MKRRSMLTAIGTVTVAGCVADASDESNTSNQGEQDLIVQDLRVPDSIEMYETFEVAVDIQNRGEATGKGELVLEIGPMTEHILVDLAAGKSETYRVKSESKFIGQLEVTINSRKTSDVRGRGTKGTIEVRPMDVGLEETVSTAEGYNISVDQIKFREAYEYKSQWSGDVETKEPENGDRFALAKVTSRNESSESNRVAGLQNLFLEDSNGEGYELEVDPAFEEPDFRGDLEGVDLYEGEKLPPDGVVSGWVFFAAPASKNVRIGWQGGPYPDEQIVYWS